MNLQRLEYSYDDSGNVTRIRDYRNSSQYQCFGYDTHDRLTRAFTGDSGCTSYASTGYGPFDHDYTYDSLHNLTSLDGPSYTYGTGNQPGAGDAGPHAVTAVGSISFGYDDSGNRITRTVGGSTTSYTYDPQNRLVAVDLAGDADDVTFVYDADGRRVSRSHGDHSTVYVGGVFEIDRDGSTVTDTRTRYRFGDTMVASRTHSPASVVFLLQDHLGSTTAGFDDTSNTAVFQWYYPYGAERHAVGSLPTEQRYTGQTSDATGNPSGDTGLLFYNARYYDPEVGAFVAADGIVPTTARSVGLNRYAYVADNPLRYTDPTGHFPPWVSDEWLREHFEFTHGPAPADGRWHRAAQGVLADALNMEIELPIGQSAKNPVATVDVGMKFKHRVYLGVEVKPESRGRGKDEAVLSFRRQQENVRAAGAGDLYPVPADQYQGQWLVTQAEDGAKLALRLEADGAAVYYEIVPRQRNGDADDQGALLRRLLGAALIVGTIAEDIATGGWGVWNDWPTLTTGVRLLIRG